MKLDIKIGDVVRLQDGTEITVMLSPPYDALAARVITHINGKPVVAEVDWSQAAEGYDYALATGPKWDGSAIFIGDIRFARRTEEGAYMDGNASLQIGKESWQIVAERPAPSTDWEGGLPPEGIVCEMQDGVGDWVGVTIFSHFNGFAHGWCYLRNQSYYSSLHSEFRPIKTQAQIEAQERELVIADMEAIYRNCGGISIQDGMSALYDHSYRKQEPKP